MANKITITAKVGPGNSVTSLVLNDVTSFKVVPANGTIEVERSPNLTQIFDISTASTFTVSISSGNYTIVIS